MAFTMVARETEEKVQFVLQTVVRETLRNITECENDSDLTRYLHVLFYSFMVTIILHEMCLKVKAWLDADE